MEFNDAAAASSFLTLCITMFEKSPKLSHLNKESRRKNCPFLSNFYILSNYSFCLISQFVRLLDYLMNFVQFYLILSNFWVLFICSYCPVFCYCVQFCPLFSNFVLNVQFCPYFQLCPYFQFCPYCPSGVTIWSEDLSNY